MGCFCKEREIISYVVKFKSESIAFLKILWNEVQSNLALRTFSVRAILVLKVKIVLILTVIYYINHQLVIGDLVLKVKQVLILTVLKAKFDCIWVAKHFIRVICKLNKYILLKTISKNIWTIQLFPEQPRIILKSMVTDHTLKFLLILCRAHLSSFRSSPF